MFAGKNNYISGASYDRKIRAKQLWQFLASKIFFRLSCLSKGHSVCHCNTHVIFPFYNVQCRGKQSKYSVSNYPCNIATDGYTYDYSNLKGCHKKIFS